MDPIWNDDDDTLSVFFDKPRSLAAIFFSYKVNFITEVA
jgi:hypothetical protein